MGTFSIPWICPECGCGCARHTIRCRCCGNESLVPGTGQQVSDNRDAGILICPYCGVRWLGASDTDPHCDTYPAGPYNYISSYSGTVTFYIYKNKNTGLYTSTGNLAYAEMYGEEGTITDNCGVPVP